jgi:hypothetical protein
MAGVYPVIRSEEETLRRVCAGASLARYGDGEFNICRGGNASAQQHHPVLQRRLREILIESGSCMVGIPNLNADALEEMTDQKRVFWSRHAVFADLLVGRPYASAFITRPDSAPWINTPAYWTQVESLWAGHDVTLVRGADSEKGLQPADLWMARSVREVLGPRRDAFDDYDRILEDIGTPSRAILCLGPTATVLAVDLRARGVHAIDLGHLGLFLRKYRSGAPMVVTAQDKALV